jgi:hypothetical protein
MFAPRPITAGILFFWPSTNGTIPAQHTRSTAHDGRHLKNVLNGSTDPGGTSGSNTHDHPGAGNTHTFVHGHTTTTNGGDSGAALGTGTGGSDALSGHVHSTTVANNAQSSGVASVTQYDATSSEPPFITAIVVAADGTTFGIPNGAVAYWNTTTVPTGFRACDGSGGAPDWRNRFVKGAAGGADAGTTGGSSDAHTHTTPLHTHSSSHDHVAPATTAGADTVGLSNGFGQPSAAAGHTHNMSGTAATDATGLAANGSVPATVAGDGQPPWYKLYAIQNNTGGVAPLPVGIIGMWSGALTAVPARWRLCDGNNGTPNLLDKFVKALNTTGELGTTGGAATHTHTAPSTHSHVLSTHGHTIGSLSMGVPNSTTNCTSGGGVSSTTHTHNNLPTLGNNSVTSSSDAPGTATANTTNKPAQTDVAYVQFLG